MDEQRLKSGIEAILFASGDPVSAARIALVLDADEQAVLDAGAALAREYEEQGRGVRLVRLNNSLQLHSAPEYATEITRALEQRRAPKLSPASLEVLAIVAYFQPVTRAYIEQMRGVDSSYTVGVLAERGLIEACGHLEAVGRPTLYRTTDLFLRTMGISQLEELPPLPDMTGSDAAAQLQQKVDELKAAEEAKAASEEAETI
ncbi:MAG: SMC-Scp complex subunit ScpB [Oscillospiraceae bacterium]|nr:SMC-Scp complex subunit ScpB [Oscillospiraceae bacterium]